MAEQLRPEGRVDTEAQPFQSLAESRHVGAGSEGDIHQGHQPFGAGLEPFLQQACDGRLSSINWFRTDWQRGGALTGYATFVDDDGQRRPVVVKLPVPPVERQWLVRLQPAPSVVPHVLAHGDTLKGYDMAWVVIERLAHGPLGSTWGGVEIDLLAAAAARFYAAAAGYATHHAPPPDGDRDWHDILDRARRSVQDNNIGPLQRWSQALKKARKKLKDWLTIWDDRPTDQWCHGDLHLANAMTRDAPPKGPAILIDFARVHCGHWVEDAVYFEHLYWSRRERLGGRNLCRLIASARQQVGLSNDDHWARYAEIYRALVAMSTPAMLEHEGDPHHLDATLEVLEAAVGR